MLDTNTIDQIVVGVEDLLNISIVHTNFPYLQGMDGDVFIVTDQNGTEYVIKYSFLAINDVVALEMISHANLNIPTPKIFGFFSFEGKTIIILEKITYSLLEDIATEKHYLYIKPMIETLKKVHTIKSKIAGFVSKQEYVLSWQQFLLDMYSGNSPFFNWDNIIHRTGVDNNLIRNTLNLVVKKIKKQDFTDLTYSLLHTDFNQRNLFVDENSHAITSIIDWSEAMFGDALYDFARVRMYIFHFNLKNGSLERYYDLLQLANNEKEREELYFLVQVLNYIGWYSEVKNDFNVSRIGLHQNFLKNYVW